MTEDLRAESPFGPALPSNVPTDLEHASDTELILLVRSGDSAAYEQLFLRHRSVALRYARRIADSERAEDLCAEAFMKILDLLQRGKGPDVAFRAYLLTTVRTSHLNAMRTGSREDLVPDHEPISRMMPVLEDPDARFEQDAICRAFYQLPERWQAALWLTAVEGFTNDEVSERLGIKSNAVASLAFRARAGLRQAYLAEHLLETTDPACRRVVEQLPNHLRGTTSARRRKQVDEHLAGCRSCTTAALEIAQVDRELGALLAPLLFTGFAVGGAALIVPAKASGLLALGATTKSGLAVGNAKAAGATAPGILGTKLAVAASVTALGLAVGSQVIRPHHAPDVPRDVTITAPERLRIEAQRDTTPTPNAASAPTSAPSPPVTLRAPAPTPSVAVPRAEVLPPVVDPTPYAAPTGPSSPFDPDTTTAPAPVVTPSSPTSPTPPAPTPTPTATPSPRSMAVGRVTQQSYTRNGVRHQQVTVPVTEPAKGATMVVSADRAIETPTVATDGTGWVCGTPQMNWLDGLLFATSRFNCQYFANGNGGPLVFDYIVSAHSLLKVNLTPPAGTPDASLTDNVLQLLLLP